MALSLSDVANQYLGQEGAYPLTEAGPNCSQIGQVIGVDNSIPLIATIFWQAFINSPAFPRALERAGSSFLAVKNSEKFIVGHGATPFPRHDLIVFDPDFRREEPGVVQPVEASPEELIGGWRLFAQTHYTAITSRYGGLILRHGEGAAVEVIGVQPFGLMVASPPTVQLTSSSAQVYCPSPAWEVAPAKNQNAGLPVADRTVGIIAQDVNKREGVTTALHDIPGIQAGTRKMYVSGVEGTLSSQDTNSVQDSCFIEIPGIASEDQRAGIVSSPTAPVVKGPLTGVTPRVNEQVKFESWAQGRQVTTHVIGWSPDIPWVIASWNQNKVLTDPDSVPGDSGTALIARIDGNDYVLGFAFYVTTSGQGGSGYSAWIWAESVFEVHKLQY